MQSVSECATKLLSVPSGLTSHIASIRPPISASAERRSNCSHAIRTFPSPHCQATAKAPGRTPVTFSFSFPSGRHFEMKHLPILLLASGTMTGTMDATVLVDRIAVIVGKQVIKSSDVERDLRVTAFINRQPIDLNAAARRKA